MDSKSPYLTMHPVSKHGYIKERVWGMTTNKHLCHYCLLICFLWSQSNPATHFVCRGICFQWFSKEVVFPEGMEPTNSEIARINQAVITRGIGLGVIFVHIFTESDIESNCLVKTDMSFFWYHASIFFHPFCIMHILISFSFFLSCLCSTFRKQLCQF
jgi:hypothetical protein